MSMYPHVTVRATPDYLTLRQPDPRVGAAFLSATTDYLLACYSGEHDPDSLLRGQRTLATLSHYYLGAEHWLLDAVVACWHAEHPA